jgi:hypothetical protein
MGIIILLKHWEMLMKACYVKRIDYNALSHGLKLLSSFAYGQYLQGVRDLASTSGVM